MELFIIALFHIILGLVMFLFIRVCEGSYYRTLNFGKNRMSVNEACQNQKPISITLTKHKNTTILKP